MSAKVIHPENSHIILWKNNKKWSVISVYPAGSAIPKNAMPYDMRTKNTLDDCYSYILEYFDDPEIAGGHAASKDETSGVGKLKPGSIIELTRSKQGWEYIVRFSDQGISSTISTYKSVREVFSKLQMEYA